MVTDESPSDEAAANPAAPAADEGSTARARDTGGTRDRILTVALDLFAEQGYDKTSLREIAERVGVTKAALYYHFKSKGDILTGSLDAYLAEVDDLIAWGKAAPPGLETQREVVKRYAQIIGRRFRAMRFVQQNPTRMQASDHGESFRARMQEVNALLSGDTGSTVRRVRALAAVLSLHVGTMAMAMDESIDPAEAAAAGVQVADELIVANNEDAGDSGR